MLLGLAASLGAGVLYGVAAVGQAKAARRLPPLSEGVVRLVLTALRSPLLMGMALSYLVGAGLHVVAIDRAPLYVAQTGIAAALPVTAITSALLLGERLHRADWIAIVSTFAGIAVLAVDAGETGETQHDSRLVVSLFVALLVVVAAGLASYRHHGRSSAAALSLLGGLAYSGTTIAARLLGTPTWSWRSVVLGLLIVVFGVLGFWLYSFAMQRVSVAAASGPLVLTETLVPTIAGIAVLGDGVPTAWVIVLGLVLALGGAVWLAGFEGRVLEDPEERAERLAADDAPEVAR